MHYKIGTRGSKLALVQAEFVRDRLQEHYPQDCFELKIIKTKGDKIQNKALSAIGDRGLFVKEIEQELLSGEIHLAVHSMKDMPGELPDGLCFAKAWKREDPRDVLVLREAKSLHELPKHAVIGTGSKRRAYQLQAIRPDIEIVDIRGNVDTRLAKMETQKLDGIVLAAAGLKRLHREDVITEYLDPNEMIPATTQGTLAIELLVDETELLEKINALSDEKTERITRTERLFLEQIGGDCHTPIGGYATETADGCIRLVAIFGNEDGSRLIRCQKTGNDPDDVVQIVVDEMKRQLYENGIFMI